jgi:hypothetical protein
LPPHAPVSGTAFPPVAHPPEQPLPGYRQISPDITGYRPTSPDIYTDICAASVLISARICAAICTAIYTDAAQIFAAVHAHLPRAFTGKIMTCAI